MHEKIVVCGKKWYKTTNPTHLFEIVGFLLTFLSCLESGFTPCYACSFNKNTVEMIEESVSVSRLGNHTTKLHPSWEALKGEHSD